MNILNPFNKEANNLYPWILGAILLIALGFRLWGVDFGLPYRTHSHEYHEINRALRLGMGEFDFTRTTKGGYFYLLFIEYGILFLILLGSGTISSVKEFSFYYLSDPSLFYLLGRTTTALMGTATVFLVFLILKRLIGIPSALIGSALLAVLPLHVELSHYISVDVPMVFLLTLTFYFSLKILERGDRKDYLLAGLFFALAVMTKFPAIILIIPLMVVHFLFVQKQGRPFKGFFNKNLIYAFSVFTLIYLLGNPGILVEFNRSFEVVSGLIYKTDLTREDITIYSGYKPNLFLYYFNILKESFGMFFIFLSILGILIRVQSGKNDGLIILIFITFFFLALSLSPTTLFYPRYVLPLFPFLAIGVAFFWQWAWDASRNWFRKNWQAHGVLSVVFLVLVIPVTGGSIETNLEINKDHIGKIAKKWVEKNIPAGSKILVDGNPESAVPGTIPIQNLSKNLMAVADKLSMEDPVKSAYLKRRAKVQTGKEYDLEMVWSKYQKFNALEYYINTGIEYIILNPRKFDRKYDSKRTHAEEFRENRFSFYDEIQNSDEVELIILLDPEKLNAQGYPLEIYQINRKPKV